MANQWVPSARRIFLFWRNVERRDPTECWPWRGVPDQRGYGHAMVAGWATTAHRIAYALANGVEKLKSDLVVMHKCDNRICCNPSHLELGTQAQNMTDMINKGRRGDTRVFGESHGRCKLSSIQVLEMKSLRASGKTQDELAAIFNVSQSQVGRVVRVENRATG